jgi:hypothetical protein
MSAQQIALPLFPGSAPAAKQPNLNLIGRSYRDDYVKVTVIGICPDDNQRVLVQRRPGQTISMLGWLMRSIFAEEDRKRKRAGNRHW